MRIGKLVLLALVLGSLAAREGTGQAANLARTAKVKASSEYDQRYQARFAVDGQIPAGDSKADVSKAWAVLGSEARHQARFMLEWDKPVKVGEIVYYGRTAWLATECWKDYEVYLDDAAKPVAKGKFEIGSGPQRIKLQPADVRKITLKFLSSHGGINPGASEIEVYEVSPPESALPKFVKYVPPQEKPWAPPADSPELAALVKEGRLGFDELLLVKRHELNPSHVYTAYCEGFKPGGGLYALSPPRPDGQLTELLASPQGQILDVDLSHDGRELVFSWRKSAAVPYRLFRMNVDGSGLTQLTDGAWHDYNACWLPDGGIAFCSTRASVFALCFTTPSGVLYRMDRDGGNVQRLSANYVNDFTPSVLPDGRILYARWEYVDKPAIPIQSLWTIHPDGTNLRVFYGNRVLSPASFLEARPIPGTQHVMCTLTAHNGPIRGGVGLLDVRHGVNAQDAIVNLTPEVDIGQVDKGSGNHVKGPYEQPYPLDDKLFLVSGKGIVLLGDMTRRWATVCRSSDNMGFYSPTPLRSRLKPPVLTTGLAQDTQATLLLVDVYQGLEPHVPRGSVKAIRVVVEVAKPLRTAVMGFGFQRPVISCGATYAVKKVLGTTPVAEDGSAYFRVPSGLPLYFEAIDANGVAVQRMRSFTHLMPGETQSCVGCHEPRNTAATKRQPPLALRQPARELDPPTWGAVNFGYVQHVQPVLDRYCVKCHSGLTPPKGVDLTGDKTDWFNVSYDVLTRGYVNWIDTRNGQEANILKVAPNTWGTPASKLTPLILSGHPDADGKKRLDLDEDSRTRLFTWIDLNVPYYGTYEMAYPSAEGGRRIYSKALDEKLTDVWARRCETCHPKRQAVLSFTRITNPQLNNFLAGPLAQSAGGRQSCRQAVFADARDPDYAALLKELESLSAQLAAKPRMDMPGAQPIQVSRSCQ